MILHTRGLQPGRSQAQCAARARVPRARPQLCVAASPDEASTSGREPSDVPSARAPAWLAVALSAALVVAPADAVLVSPNAKIARSPDAALRRSIPKVSSGDSHPKPPHPAMRHPARHPRSGQGHWQFSGLQTQVDNLRPMAPMLHDSTHDPQPPAPDAQCVSTTNDRWCGVCQAEVKNLGPGAPVRR